jgi:hypothetical protein
MVLLSLPVACAAIPTLAVDSIDASTTGFDGAADAALATDSADLADTTVDALPSDDAGDAPPTPANGGLPCGDAGPCDPASSTCCLTRLGFECVIRGTACAGANLECDRPDDCTGNKVCCVVPGADGGVKRVACIAPGACTNMAGLLACDLDGGSCAAPSVCSQSAVPGYGSCQ